MEVLCLGCSQQEGRKVDRDTGYECWEEGQEVVDIVEDVEWLVVSHVLWVFFDEYVQQFSIADIFDTDSDHILFSSEIDKQPKKALLMRDWP